MKIFQAINLSKVMSEKDSAQTVSCQDSCRGVSNEVVVVVNDALHVEQ